MSTEQRNEYDSANFDLIATELESRFRDGMEVPWTETEFESRSLKAFAHQFDHCRPYRAFCERRGVTPRTVAKWEEIPAVPATAFKYFDFVSAPAGDDSAVFQTSGTTRGQEARGRHHIPRLSLYRASLLPPLEAALLSDVPGPVRFLSLVPDPEEVPESSLSYMVGAAAERYAAETDWLVDAEGNFDMAAMASVLEVVRDANEPVLVLGTALAFVHALERSEVDLGPLPEGSRIMETGGFKGARRTISREELYQRISVETQVPTERIVNEYGMTELLSQLYEPVLTEGLDAVGVHLAPPWLRVRALDPTTLKRLPDGDDGILAFFDLANLGSICHVLTEDIGSVVGGRVRLRGRVPGSEPRGCSRAMDDLMAAAGSGG
jgi:hypothetical protein